MLLRRHLGRNSPSLVEPEPVAEVKEPVQEPQALVELKKVKKTKKAEGEE